MPKVDLEKYLGRLKADWEIVNCAGRSPEHDLQLIIATALNVSAICDVLFELREQEVCDDTDDCECAYCGDVH